LERLHIHRENGNLRAWLLAIMHDLFVSQTRRSKPRIAGGESREKGKMRLALTFRRTCIPTQPSLSVLLKASPSHSEVS
jgi:DNA-directed RNA polymerase specialized sigma24 family protein